MSGPITRCPWCSAELSIPGAETCLACGATLVGPSGGPDAEIRGVTTLDPEAILRARSDVSRPRSRILSFITGDVAPDTGEPASPASLAPPPDDVRREMLRLQAEAERADIEAETVALKSDVLAKQGISLADLAAADAANAADVPLAAGGDPAPVDDDATALAPEEPPSS